MTVPRLSAAMTPAGRPTASAKIIAQIDSSSVAGKRAANSPITLVFVMIDMPRSPFSAWPT